MRAIRKWIVEQAGKSGVTSADVMATFKVSLPAANTHIQKAKHKGLVMTYRDAGWRERQTYHITDAGRAYLEAGFDPRGRSRAVQPRRPGAERPRRALVDLPDLPDTPPAIGYGSGHIELELVWWRPASLSQPTKEYEHGQSELHAAV